MKNNKQAEMYNSSVINELLSAVSEVDAAKIEKKMLLAAKIDDALKAKKWKKKDLLQAMGKTNPSEVTKWLSGTHNFTIETLIDLELVLGIKLLNINIEVEPASAKYYVAVSSQINNVQPSYHLNDFSENENGSQNKSSFIIS